MSASGLSVKPRRFAALAGLSILAAGLWLRLFQIGQQILIDDEWHALVKLADSDYAAIARSFGLADHSIPLTLFYKWVAEQGRLSEAWMLAPAWICGVAACVFAVCAVRRAASPLALLAFAGLLAVSPLLVHFTRQARPYAITLFLAVVAIWAAWRWSQEGKARYAILHLFCGVLAVYFHMIVAPMVLGVWLYLGVEWFFGDRRDPKRLAAIVAWGALAGVLLAALLGSPLVNDWRVLAVKAGTDRPTAYTVWRTAQMMAGTTSPWLLLAMIGLLLIGARALWHRHPRATRFVLALIALQILAVVLSGALWLSHALVLSRYLLVPLPFMLFAVAVGFAWCCERAFAAHRWTAGAIGAALLLDLYATGPLPAALAYPNAFFEHYVYFFDFDTRHNEVIGQLREGPMPAFYRDLARLPPGSKTLIEAPWRFESIFNRQALFQQVHRQHVKIGMVGGLCPPGAFAEHPRRFKSKFRHFIDLAQPLEELGRKADYVVFHKRLDLDYMTKEWMLAGGRTLPPVEACIAAFSRRLGNPAFEDATIAVFDLRRR